MRARTLAIAAAATLVLAIPARAQVRVGDLTLHGGDVPRRLAGYGLVVGLDGSGDRSFGGVRSPTPTVRSVINLLRRFNIEVPADQLRLRNVAAVLVTAEASPYLRAGGRFEVQVSALGDATTLRGGVLWITPLVTDPTEPPVATAQGPLLVASEDAARGVTARRGNSARIAQGGVLEIDPPKAAGAADTRLLLREPDLANATRIAAAVNAAFGNATAKVTDPGAVELAPGAKSADLNGFLAAVDTVLVEPHEPARIVISSREGTVVAGGALRVAPVVVSHHGITLAIGNAPPTPGSATNGLVHMAQPASVEDVAAGLHAAGARPDDIAAIFEALGRAGALAAQVVIR